jgi:hypothetical protein
MNINSYLETALWSSCDLDGTPLDRDYSIEDIDVDFVRQSLHDCNAFKKIAGTKGIDLDSSDFENWQHDFWLTRNGHGAGFWDGDYPDDIGEILTKLSKRFRPVDLFVSENKTIIAL